MFGLYLKWWIYWNSSLFGELESVASSSSHDSDSSASDDSCVSFVPWGLNPSSVGGGSSDVVPEVDPVSCILALSEVSECFDEVCLVGWSQVSHHGGEVHLFSSGSSGSGDDLLESGSTSVDDNWSVPLREFSGSSYFCEEVFDVSGDLSVSSNLAPDVVVMFSVGSVVESKEVLESKSGFGVLNSSQVKSGSSWEVNSSHDSSDGSSWSDASVSDDSASDDLATSSDSSSGPTSSSGLPPDSKLSRSADSFPHSQPVWTSLSSCELGAC